MGSVNHFISMVLVDGLWLFYDGLGIFRNDEYIPCLRVLDRNARPEALKYFTLTCIFYEVYPYNILGEDLMCKESSSTVDHHNDDQFEETAVDDDAAEAMTESEEVGDTLSVNAANEFTMKSDDHTSVDESGYYNLDQLEKTAEINHDTPEATTENEEVGNTFDNIADEHKSIDEPEDSSEPKNKRVSLEDSMQNLRDEVKKPSVKQEPDKRKQWQKRQHWLNTRKPSAN